MSARVGFDVGGTFTDLVLRSPDGRLHTHVERFELIPDTGGGGVPRRLRHPA